MQHCVVRGLLTEFFLQKMGRRQCKKNRKSGCKHFSFSYSTVILKGLFQHKIVSGGLKAFAADKWFR